MPERLKSVALAFLRCLARQPSRHSAKVLASPTWLSDEHEDQIADNYEQAVFAEQLTGLRQHVDYIEPLQAKIVAGFTRPAIFSL